MAERRRDVVTADEGALRRIWAAAAGCLIVFTLIALVAEGYKHPRDVLQGTQDSHPSSLSGDINMLWAAATAAATQKSAVPTSVEKQTEIKAASVSSKSMAMAASVKEDSTSSTSKSASSSPTPKSTSALTSSPPSVSISANGTVTVTPGIVEESDEGSIGPDGKRQGELGEVPSFAFPIAMAVGGLVLLFGVCMYMNYCTSTSVEQKYGGGKKGTQT